MDWNVIEKDRIKLQAKLDSAKSPLARNKLGQYATPTDLARDIVGYGLNLLPLKAKVRFFDPAFGTGSFFSALRFCLSKTKKVLETAVSYEIDNHYYEPTRSLWNDKKLTSYLQDFTLANSPKNKSERANLLICNPPYVRHHHLTRDKKIELQAASQKVAGIKVKGLAGLHVYFILLSHKWLADDGIAGWLIPSEFMDVGYGSALKEYLSKKVTLVRIHRFDPKEIQFGDATVSSAIVWYRNAKPAAEHEVEFTFGGSLSSPKVTNHVPLSSLDPAKKWSRIAQGSLKDKVYEGKRLGDLLIIKRGIATGNNKFFVLTPLEAKKIGIPSKFLKPILPSAKYIGSNEILADKKGLPIVEKHQFVIDCKLSKEEIRAKYPKFWKYLEQGLSGEVSVASGFLISKRKPWYSQEVRSPAPIVCTYMGREKESKQPFRFFLNHSQAIVGNSYLMLYPRQDLHEPLSKGQIRKIWETLNTIKPSRLLSAGRVYGGGLYKLEPKELANLIIKNI